MHCCKTSAHAHQSTSLDCSGFAVLDCESVFLQYLMFSFELESHISSNNFSFKLMQ